MPSAVVTERQVSPTYSALPDVAAPDEGGAAETGPEAPLPWLANSSGAPSKVAQGPPVAPVAPATMSFGTIGRIPAWSAAAPALQGGSDFGVAQPVNARRESRTVDIEIAEEAKPYLRDANVAFIFERLVPLCINQAKIANVTIQRLQLTTKRSREEQWLELVLKVFVPLTPAQGLGLWDALGDALMRWSRNLPQRQSTILAERFAVFVEPTVSREL